MHSAILHALVFLLSFAPPKTPQQLLNRPVPRIEGRTLTGKRIDASYFQGQVTVLNFMYLGCPPCMAELPLLRRIQEQYAGRVQVLSVAAHPAERLRRFNGSDQSAEARLRRAVRAEPIGHEILPECGETKILKPITGFSPECETISRRFFLGGGYPCTFLVDRHGIIRRVYEGAPTAEPYVSAYNQKLLTELEQLLAEKQ